MRLLICSYEFDVGSEGVCTGRLVRALLSAGCEVDVVTSPVGRNTFQHERLRYYVVPSAPLRPAKLFFHLAPLLGQIPTRVGYIWSRRVAALRLERQPEIVYGRANPFQSIVAAHALARRGNLRLWAHLSDPMPSPWWDRFHPEYESTLYGVRRIAQEAQALTLTTNQGLKFQEALLEQSLDDKAFVLNHVAPEPTCLPVRQGGEGKVFAYFGLFYGERNPTALLQGFQLHLRNRPNDRFLFVGAEPQTVMAPACRLGIECAVTVLPRVDDVRRVMAKVDVLVAVDAFSSAPVFLPTKVVEYLVVNRPVLLISPEDSPGSVLLRKLPQTTTVVTSDQPDAVSAGFAFSSSYQPDESAYRARFAEMQPFSATSVAACFLEQARARNGLATPEQIR